MAKLERLEKKRNNSGDIVLDSFDSYKDNSSGLSLKTVGFYLRVIMINLRSLKIYILMIMMKVMNLCHMEKCYIV